MSVVFEPRSFHGDIYPSIGGVHDVSELDRFAEADVSDVADLAAVAVGTYTHHHDLDLGQSGGGDGGLSRHAGQHQGSPLLMDGAADAGMLVEDKYGSPATTATGGGNMSVVEQALMSSPSKENSPSMTQHGRVKAIPKPEREVTKNEEGKYCCTWVECTEEVKDFGRKCEWSKHMDKHERPYRCTAIGCEKLPGFTYSGGLLRHEREVHGKYGGPRNALHCPHTSCKRHTGKGFSRQENLSEHLRRVHTSNGNGTAMHGTGHSRSGGEEETDDAASDIMASTMQRNGSNNGLPTPTNSAPGSSTKRKREPDDVGEGSNTIPPETREEMRRLQMENAELRKQVENQNLQTVSLMSRIMQLQETIEQLAPTTTI